MRESQTEECVSIFSSRDGGGAEDGYVHKQWVAHEDREVEMW